MMKFCFLKIVFFIFLIGSSNIILAQPKTQRTTDSLAKVEQDTLKKWLPNPKKALLWSLLPGGGQIYNRKYWYVKLPVVYGGFGVGTYLMVQNYNAYSYYKREHYNLVNNLPSELPTTVNVARVKSVRDANFKAYQQAIMFTAIWYLAQSMEAFTAAHLMNFDINENLSMQIKPSFEPLPYGNAMGFGLKFNLK
jgi:hypothetical protein